MAITVRQIYGNVYSTATALASVQFPRTGRIIAALFAISGAAAEATDARGEVQLSRTNIQQVGVNDAQNLVATISWSAPTASVTVHYNVLVPTGGVEVKAGDYIYLHAYRAGTQPSSLACQCTVFVQD